MGLVLAELDLPARLSPLPSGMGGSGLPIDVCGRRESLMARVRPCEPVMADSRREGEAVAVAVGVDDDEEGGAGAARTRSVLLEATTAGARSPRGRMLTYRRRRTRRIPDLCPSATKGHWKSSSLP